LAENQEHLRKLFATQKLSIWEIYGCFYISLNVGGNTTRKLRGEENISLWIQILVNLCEKSEIFLEGLMGCPLKKKPLTLVGTELYILRSNIAPSW